MVRITTSALALLCASAAWGQANDAAPAFSGQVRLQWDARPANTAGPLAQANALVPGTAALTGNGPTLEAELRSSGRGWNVSATLQQGSQGSGSVHRAWFNELVATHDAGSWQFSAGKKIVAWDVGYAFRPNDFVQQEERRTLISTLAEGRPVLMAEHFDAETAWSWVWVNPTQTHSEPGAKEPALAARVYQRQGAVDWHGFARLGTHTGASLGAALAWVASDAVELHASARYLNRADSRAIDPAATGLVRSDPWRASSLPHAAQALLGGTWTHASQFSLLAEAWWDGSALSNRQWDAWRARNASLSALVGAPASAVAGNLAWQADAFAASSSLRRSNLYARLSWEHDGWQPALDLLVQPTDGGRLLTAALLRKGDRVQLQGGLRCASGPADALLRQLPTRRQAYMTGTWAY